MAAGRKREGIDALKSTTGGKRRDDRQVIGKTLFDPITIDAKNALTVIYLLRSPEDNVMLRAVASLEVFGRKDPENFKLLCSLGIFEYVYPLINHSDNIVKRFTLKLIGMLCGLEEFREQMLGVENILETYADILRQETDVVLQEFASLTLAELSKDYQGASDLLKVDHIVDTLFEKIVSLDPDLEKNCLDIMSNLLDDVNGVEAFVESPAFDLKLLLNLTSSSYPLIQAMVLEILKKLTAVCRNAKALMAFRDAKGIEISLSILEQEEWSDLHQGALDLILNIVDCPVLCEYLRTSGSLSQLMSLLDNLENLNFVRIILGILARMAATREGAQALLLYEMDDRFVDFLALDDDDEIIQLQSSLGIANLAKNGQTVKKKFTKSPIMQLKQILTNPEKNTDLRNMAAYALSVLAKTEKKLAEMLVETESYKELFPILMENADLPTEICQNVIHVFIGIALHVDLKREIISENFISALLSCLPTENGYKDPSLQVDALECLSEYMIENETRLIFQALNGVDAIVTCLHSKFASVREWAGHLTVFAAQNVEFIKSFIHKKGLSWMLKEKNTMYSMPSWQSAVETIFTNFLPAKFAFTGRLDFQDITQDGFYVYSNPRSPFMVIEDLLNQNLSPIIPVYLATFDTSFTRQENGEMTSRTGKISAPNSAESRHQKEVERHRGEGERHAPKEENICSLEKCLPDPYLKGYLEILRKKIREEPFNGDPAWHNLHPELIIRRVRLIAELVVSEMSGPEPDLNCHSAYKEAHLKELRHFLGTNITPLGGIRMGSFLERAMLFKVLADRIGFPCALVRGCYGRAWIEIAVPLINIEDVEEGNMSFRLGSIVICNESKSTSENFSESGSSPSQRSAHFVCTVAPDDNYWYPEIKVDDFKCLPHQFLKPNAIVDLVNEPGRIVGIHTLEAEEYCGSLLYPKSLNR